MRIIQSMTIIFNNMNKNKNLNNNNNNNNNTAQETYLSMSIGRHKRLKELPAKHKGNQYNNII
jgi:hypothetical protein